jgi:DNA-binding IclR family transcriptional regulator
MEYPLPGPTERVERVLRNWVDSESPTLEVISRMADTNYNTTRGCCIRLVQRGVAQRVGKGRYRISRTAPEAAK